MNTPGRLRYLLLIGVVLLSIAVGPVASADPVGHASDISAPTGDLASRTPANNTTVQQEDPDRIDAASNTGNLEGWLASQLSARLRSSSTKISQGQYEAAQDLLGEGYRERYSQYVEVTGGTSDSEATDTSFEKAQENQQQLANATQRYRATYEQYQRARANNETERARILARNLTRLSERITNSSTTLRSNLQTVSENTGANVTEANRTATNISRNVSQQVRQVEREMFVETNLTARPHARQASFREPLIVEGRLTATNGAAVAQESVVFRIGKQTKTASITANGTFRFAYRPTTLPLNASEIIIQYVPGESSVYLGSNATVPIAPMQVTPEITISAPEQSAYNKTISVTGFVGVDSQGAPNVPVRVSINDTHLGTVRTGTNGTFSLPVVIPASLTARIHRLTAEVALRNQTLTAANTSTSLIVHETSTNLIAHAVRAGDGVRVTGTLSTFDGRPIPNRSVAITIDGRPMANVETAENGSYVAVIPIAESALESGSVTVNAQFDGARTSLTASSADTRIKHVQEESIDKGVFARLQSSGWWLGLLGFCIALGLGWTLYRRFDGFGGSSTTDTSTTGLQTSTADVGDTTTPEMTRALLDTARDQLSHGQTDHAVQTAYTAARTQLEDRFATNASLTHWEVFESCHEGGLDHDQLDALQQVTEVYEQAAFAVHVVSSDAASRAVDAVATLDRNTPRDKTRREQ